MSSYEVERNIANAFKVVYKTYENAKKLMSFLRGAAEKNGYICCTDNPITWRENSNLNNDIYGWAFGRFVMVFRKKDDKENNEDLREGSLFVLCINLGYFESTNNKHENETDDIAKIHLARFDYGKNALPEKYVLWMFDRPIFWKNIMTYLNKDNYYSYGTRPVSGDYGGLKQVVKCSVPLTEIKSDNAEEKIFEEFNKLSSLTFEISDTHPPA